jgi:Domain of unknown function (DUF4252)
MPRIPQFARLAFLALLTVSPLLLRAQPAAYPDDSWIPQGMEALGHHASFHTDLTFDKSMLDMASNFVGDDDTRRVVAKLRGISVHTYRYPAPGLYDPAALDAVRAQYRDRGWKHMVTSQTHAAAANPGRTDVWIRFEHGDVEGMVLLVAGQTNLNLVAVNGTLSPLDLLHLRGHFGIPRFDGDLVEKNN